MWFHEGSRNCASNGLEQCLVSLVVHATKKLDKVPWEVKNRWSNAMASFRNRNCIVTHIYREGNQVADTLANQSFSIDNYTVWLDVPSFIREHFVKDKLGWPNYKFG